MDHRQAVDRERVERARAADMPVARVKDEVDTRQVGDHPAGQLWRVDRAVAEAEELEGDSPGGHPNAIDYARW
jgi:hypothetical protein